MQYSTVQYSAIHCTMQHITVRYSRVQYSTAPYKTGQYSIAEHSAAQFSTVQYNAAKYSTLQYSTVQCAAKNVLTPKHYVLLSTITGHEFGSVYVRGYCWLMRHVCKWRPMPVMLRHQIVRSGTKGTTASSRRNSLLANETVPQSAVVQRSKAPSIHR